MTPWHRLGVAFAMVMACAGASAHGGVGVEDDKCIMRIGNARAHFSGYQPELRASQEFCEDIPEVGRAVFVVDFVDQDLRERVVEFRVLRDSQALGAKARYEALGDTARIEADTLVKLAAAKYPRGTLTFDHRFTEAGWKVGLLSATDPKTGSTVHSVFPFRVGVRSYGKYIVPFLVIAALAFLMYRATSTRTKGR